MTAAVFAFRECAAPAARLAQQLGIDCREVSVRRFPDGESLVRVARTADTALLYRSLDSPNEKILELVLAASALRDGGTRKLILVVPYLAYMRQDRAFRTGEAVSQRVIGKLLADHCDGLITIDPHLHRVHSLAAVMAGIQAVSISAAPALSAALDKADNPLLVGPDGESEQWVQALARQARLDYLLGRKSRRGDRDVELGIPDASRAKGRKVVLIDDLISSGATLKAAARLLREAGALSLEVMATHCLATPRDLAELRGEGIGSIRSTETVAGPTASIGIAGLLANAIRRQGWC